MADLSGFDASEVEPRASFGPIPEGQYLAHIIDSSYKKTKLGDGEYLQLCFEILDGDHKGRRLWDQLNLHNPKEKTVEIARATLSAICRAVGVLRPKDSEELHGKPISIRVVIQERSDKAGEFKNVIRGYSSTNGSAPAPATPATGGEKVPPWKRKA